MPPILALFLCFIFCISLYIKDSKNESDVSVALWIPTLWLMLCGSRSLDLWFNPSRDIVTGEGGSIDRIFLITLITITSLVLSQRKVNWHKIYKGNAWILILYAYMLISIVWTESPLISLKRWFRTLGDLMVVMVILTESNPFKAIVTAYKRCFILLIPLSVVLIKYFRQYGTQEPKHFASNFWVGVTTHKNSLGLLAMLAALLFLWNIFQKDKKGKIVAIVYLIMIAYLLNGGGHTRSSTAIVLIPIAVAAYLFMGKYKSRPERLLPVIVGAFVITLVINVSAEFIFGAPIDEIISLAIGKDPTLTGRTLLWQELIALGRRHFFLGYGYEGFWTQPIMQYLKEVNDGIHSWGPSQSHNGYIEVFLNLGILGLIFLGFVVISAFKGTIKHFYQNFDYGRIRIVLLLILMFHNYSEASFTKPTHLPWFTFLLVAVNVPYFEHSSSKSPVVAVREMKNNIVFEKA